MPGFKHRITLNLTRRVKAFLGVCAGLTRGAASDPEQRLAEQADKLRKAHGRIERARRQISEKDRRLTESRRRLSRLRERLEKSEGAPSNPEQTRERLADRNRATAETVSGEGGGNVQRNPATVWYLELVKRSLMDSIYGDAEVRGRFPPRAHTMIGFERLDNLQFCVESVLEDGVPGDLIETGVWRGGATILMREILRAYDVRDRRVWVADSFRGLPPPDEKYPQDEGDDLHTFDEFVVSLEQVKANFERYGPPEDQVRFLKGWFRDTLPDAPVERLAVIRLDGDMYESTMDALVNLYPKLSEGGYLIVDDYGNFSACRQAVHEYREEHGITEEIVPVDWSAVYWRRAG